MTNRRSSPKPKGALARAKEMDLARQPRLAARIAVCLCGMIGGLIFLAAKTDVPNVTRAPGAILPHGNYSQVETLEGGVVAAIHVVEGQSVAAGTPLVDLKQPDLVRRAETLRMQKVNEKARYDNLQALRNALEKTQPPSPQTVANLRVSGFSDAADQLQLHVETQVIKTEAIDRQSKTVKILREALAFNEERVKAKKVQLETAGTLRDQGLMTARSYQIDEEQLNNLRAGAHAARVDLAQARNDLGRMITDRQSTRLKLQEKVLADTQAARDVLVDLTAELADSDARLADLFIVAPEAGVVQSVALPNIGEVIEPGETLFELVPQRRGLVIEARIPSGDIGHINASQSVSIGVDTFDPRRFGKLEGHLLSLSPVPITDEATGEHYFRAAIGLDRSQIGQGNMERPLRAGMTVIAEIVTGEQTMLAYFLKPIDATLNRSFRER